MVFDRVCLQFVIVIDRFQFRLMAFRVSEVNEHFSVPSADSFDGKRCW